ncbi:DUF3887 domain-containing protein [Thermococcus sp.]
MEMKRLVLVLLLASLLFSQVLATNGNAFMEEFIKAFNTDNYSLIEPYMSPQLREQFSEKYFREIRDFTMANYGRLISFKLVSNTTSGDMVKLEYEVKAEKGSFPVLLVYKNGELVGLGLGVKAKPNPTGMVAMILGSLLALGGIYALRRKLAVPDLILGSGLALALSVVIPFYGIVTLVTIYSTMPRVITTAFLTALTVEGAKFYLSRRRDGLSLGLGLGIGQYVLLAIGTFVATNFIMQLPVSFTGKTYWAFLVALIFTTFHALTAEVYSLHKNPFHLILFIALGTGALAFESLNNVGMGLLLALVGIIIGFYAGGVLNGVTGRETR